MRDHAPMECPKCSSSSIETTTMGVSLTAEGYDDGNSATCTSCGRKGRVGDWQRITALREKLRALCDAVDDVGPVGFSLLELALRQAREVLRP